MIDENTNDIDPNNFLAPIVTSKSKDDAVILVLCIAVILFIVYVLLESNLFYNKSLNNAD